MSLHFTANVAKPRSLAVPSQPQRWALAEDRGPLVLGDPGDRISLGGLGGAADPEDKAAPRWPRGAAPATRGQGS